MNPFIIDERQPFGVVEEHKVMPGAPCDPGYSAKPCGPTTVRFDNGVDHGPSFANKAPSAHSYASRNDDKPFSWTGMPSGRM